jgi:glycosyltransferase involved in cell wall biosynthesis
LENLLPIVQIVVPCYNPQPGWAEILAERYFALRSSLSGLCRLELILVNDGSTLGFDRGDVVKLQSAYSDIQFVDNQTNRGKGAALRSGVAITHAPYILMTDIDFPYTTQSMHTVVESLIQSGGIVSGHREENYYEKVPFFRQILSKSLRIMLKYVMRLPVTDSQCGLKGMDISGKALFLETTIDRYLFDLEFLQKANKKVPVRPVSVQLREGVVFTQMGLGILRTEFGNFLKLLKW